MFKLFCDGGSRGNPGPSASGAVLYDEKNQEVLSDKEFLGRATNNIAEYSSLLLGLRLAKSLKINQLEIYMDSKLVVEQMSRRWKIKDSKLKELSSLAFIELMNISKHSFHYIPREQNKVADGLVNQAFDENL